METVMPLTLPQRTVYFSLPMQMYMNTEIKKPALQAVAILFSAEASKVNKLKAMKGLWEVFNSLKGLPTPTKENTWHPNTHRLIELRDWLFERCFLGVLRMSFIRRVVDFIIILYDFDPPWRWIFDSLREEALRKDWKGRGFSDTWRNDYVWWRE